MTLAKIIDEVVEQYGADSIEANILIASFIEDDLLTFLNVYKEFIS